MFLGALPVSPVCVCVCVFVDWLKKERDREREREGCVNVHMVKHNIVALVCACWYMSMWTRMGNQSCFGTLQEVINSQDYCADTVISKVLHNSLCGEG